MWEFRKITAIEEPVFNNVLERFYNLGLDGLVRENIQNSLDGKLPESNLPVEVKIKTGDIPASEIPGIDEIKRHIQSLKGENSYTKETIAHMKKEMEKETVPFISFEDSNTKGLTGAEHGENFQEGDTWGVYAYKKGVHFTEYNMQIPEKYKWQAGTHGSAWKYCCSLIGAAPTPYYKAGEALMDHNYDKVLKSRIHDKTVPIRDTYQRLQKAQKEKNEVVQYKIGDSVTHPKFGNGIVEKINPRSGGVHLHIRFDDDVKCIDQKWLIKKYKKQRCGQ